MLSCLAFKASGVPAAASALFHPVQLIGAFFDQPSTSIFAPQAAPARSIYGLSLLVLGICAVIFLIVASLLTYAIIRFRHRRGTRRMQPIRQQHALTARAAPSHVRAQILRARLRPLPHLQQQRHFLLACATHRHAAPPSFSSRAALCRARNNSNRTLADASPVTSAISLCE